MLRTRIITAVALLPLVWALVFVAPPAWFAVAVGMLLLVGTWEFHRLASLSRNVGLVLLALQAALLALLYIRWPGWAVESRGVFQLACLAWLVMFMQLRFFQPGQAPGKAYQWRGFLNALGVITFGWMALSWIRFDAAGQWWILAFLLIIWAADIGAYFTGRALGKRKLAPAISPGKTWAGLAGGLLLAAAVALGLALCLPVLDAPVLPLIVIGLVTALASAGGDLFISMHKRSVGLKDSGRLFPGHGGVLDRLDSWLAGAPFFVLGKLVAGL